MQCICVRTCYIRVQEDKRPQLFRINEIVDFDKCPMHFVSIDSADLDFESVPLDVLVESDGWDKDDLIALAEKKYKVKISKNLRRETVAKKFVEARDRYVEGLYKIQPE